MLLSDPGLGPAAERIAECLVTAGGQAAPIAVLYDDSDGLLRGICQGFPEARLVPIGPQAAVQQIEQVAEQARREQFGAHKAVFGAGALREARRMEGLGSHLTPGLMDVHQEDDLRAAARRAARLAFGRDWALGGWDAQALRRVRVARRLFSPFTAALLEELEEERSLDPAPWPYEREMQKTLREARQMGLGEGATLIHEGHRPSHRSSQPVILTRLVFTNVEAGMGLLGIPSPVPLLLLERSGSRSITSP